MRRSLIVAGLLLGLVAVPAAAEPTSSGVGAEPVPEAVTADWVRLSAGNYHGCGIRTSGRLYCWGDDGLGQLGVAATNSDQPRPVQVDGGFTDWVAVEAGGNHTCARRRNGRLYCWGDDQYGQVGNVATNFTETSPVEVAGGFTDWTTFSAGGRHTCGRRSTGQLLCWGADHAGQLGDGGDNENQPTPVPVVGANARWAAVGLGEHHTCARRNNGRLYCWGTDDHGQLGNGGTNTDRDVPTLVAGTSTAWTTVTGGSYHTCARRNTGRLFCWGDDFYGQLGDGGPNTQRRAPVQVAGGHTTWTAVSAGGGHTCARRSSGRLFCWGADLSGALGNGLPFAERHAPVQVAGAHTTWTAVTSGSFQTCARRSSGRIFCWGADSNEELGNGPGATSRPAPVPVG